jgi:ATP-dependent Clp protease ATP-binding subunit ClpA
MSRVIHQAIKTPLADEVLFGRLKNGGAVRVVVVGDDKGAKKLGFVFPEGPVLPRPERDIIEAGKKRAAEEAELGRDNEAAPPDAEEPGSSPESVRN